MEMRADHASDNNDHREADSDAEGPRADDDHKCESEGYNTQPVESDEEDLPVKCTVGGSDNNNKPAVKHEQGGASSAEGQGSSSDEEERNKMAADSDSDHKQDRPLAGSPDFHSNADSDSDTEMPARPPGHIDSEEEEQGENGSEVGTGVRWKAMMQSDSEEDIMRKISKGSDEEQQEEEEHGNASDNGPPGTSQ